MSCLTDSKIQIVFWDNTYWATEVQEAAVLAWVKNGGALLWGLTAWKWQDETE